MTVTSIYTSFIASDNYEEWIERKKKKSHMERNGQGAVTSSFVYTHKLSKRK